MDAEARSTRTQYRAVLGFVRRRVASPETAEDITQEVFAQAAEALARSAGGAPPTLGWLYTVARRRLIDRERRRRQVSTVSLDLVDDPHARGQEYGPAVARTLAAGLSRLPEKQRDVVVMRLLEGRSFAEIGDALGVTVEACRMRFMRALEQLRTDFEKEGLNP